MATDFERNSYKATSQGGLGGAAMRRMQELAQSLYDSTPGLQEEVPRHTSKILANIKKEDNRAEKRAQAFIGGEHGGLRKGGSIEKKDLTIAMTAEDWETKYKEIWDHFKSEKEATKELKERMIRKQERYIAREHEYRRTIEQIEKNIEEKSTKPLAIIQEQDENQLLLSGLDPSHPEQQEMMDKERRQKLKNEQHINQKNVRLIHQLYDKLNETVGLVQESTAKELWKQRWEILQTLDKKLEDIKLSLKAETEKKKEDQYDFKEKERELNEHLETMTQIAQRIDDENRNLMKKNSDLKIQYLSQENDRDLLLKQLIFQKKENQNLRKKAEEIKKRAETLQQGNPSKDNIMNDDRTLNMDISKSNLPNPYVNQQNASMNQRIIQGRQSQNNLSGFNNNSSRRNISLTANNMFLGPGRPKTAAMGGGGLPRPPTAYHQGMSFGGKKTNMTTTNENQQLNFVGGGRAISANIMNNPKVKRYEDLIFRLKKMLSMEKKSLRMVRTMCSKEIEIKNALEKILRQCVDDVKSEIAKKKSENKSIYYAKGRKGQNDLMDERNLTQQEREKIIEVLLSQERVLTLLYDKTFPPRPATAKIGLKNAFQGQNLTNEDSNNMRQFNYYGQVNNRDMVEEIDEADVERLEREIEEVLKNREPNGGIGVASRIVNINSSKADLSRGKSAGTMMMMGAKRNLMSAAYRQNRPGEENTNENFADDIYEDDESSGNEFD